MLPSLTLLHQLRLRGSLTAAAEATNTSRSAASHQLAGLQRRLGVTLTERVGRGLRLTEAGHALALQAARVLSEMERTTAIAEQSRGDLAGTVVVATVQTIAVAVVPRLLTRVRSDHPSLRVEVRDLASRHAIRSVSAGEADVAVVPQYDTAPLRPDTALRRHHLFRDPIVVALPPDHRLAHTGTAVDLADLADERWVTGDPDGHFGRLVPSLCHRAGFDPDIRHRSDDYLVIAALVADGHGVGLLPASARPHAHAVVTRPITSSDGRDIVAFTRGSGLERPTVSTVVQVLTAICSRP
ncbi:MAG TPA: LysR family transcriptional regulator [Candidatus Stackebrandtia excrementipullorum]|nr:LysR family transcriptional regulator [Candidatus Stackebrandtia excrementipullorum]